MSIQKHFDYHGRDVAYWEFGRESDPTILMVHGFRGTHHGLQRIVDELPNFHVIVPDLPGFGDSQPFTDSAHDINSYVAFLHEFIKAINGSGLPVLLGHSFGSIISSHYAAKYPSAVKKVILINPIGAPALEGPKAVLSKLAIFYYFLGKKLPQHLSHAWLSTPAIVKIMSVSMTKTHDADTRRYVHDQHLRYFSRFAHPDVVAEAFTASVSHDVREVAAYITAPTLLIAGEKDDITPLEKQESLAKLFPHAQLQVISEVGHLIHYEAALEAAQMIRTFMNE